MKPRLRFDDFYIKGRLLGEGSFGSVYQATDRRTNNIVAIKTIKYVRCFQSGVRRDTDSVLLQPAGDTLALTQNLEEVRFLYFSTTRVAQYPADLQIAAMENIQHPHVIKIFAAHHSETVPQICELKFPTEAN